MTVFTSNLHRNVSSPQKLFYESLVPATLRAPAPCSPDATANGLFGIVLRFGLRGRASSRLSRLVWSPCSPHSPHSAPDADGDAMRNATLGAHGQRRALRLVVVTE